jgi:hypothetical protein
MLTDLCDSGAIEQDADIVVCFMCLAELPERRCQYYGSDHCQAADGTNWGREGIVKLLGLMPSPDSRGRILGSIFTDPALRPPAPYP